MSKIITISREFGSGGREIGKRLADELNFKYYDKEIIEELAKETNLAEKYIENISERGIYPIAFNFGKTFTTFNNLQSNQTEILIKQQEIIKKIAQKGDCIIVGRGADSILKAYNPINIFVYSNIESKINRCKEKREDEKISDKELMEKIKQVDKNRKKYYDLISTNEWGKKENYDICINTSKIKIKNIIPALAEYIKSYR